MNWPSLKGMSWSRLKRPLGWSLAILAVLAVGGVLFVLSGIYNVAASSSHFAVTRWFLEIAMQRSVVTHSASTEIPAYRDNDHVRLGAGHYDDGCAPCHGAPGRPRNPIVRYMLPAPPDLRHVVPDWQPEELFWIVLHGIKYTGMPAWTAPRRQDEVWSVVAFLEKLPDLSAADYRRLTDDAAPPPRMARGATGIGRAIAPLTLCVRCHGDETTPPTSRLVPKLAGQPAPFLKAALTAYAEGLRSSGIMQPVAFELDADTIARLAAYYSGLSPNPANDRSARGKPDGIQGAASSSLLARGREIAENGIAADAIPPCLTCHGSAAAPMFPRLAGQYARYISRQLALFRDGVRGRTKAGAIMAPIARRLTDEQVEAVAAYFESLPPTQWSGGAATADAKGDASNETDSAAPEQPEASSAQ